MTGEFRREAEGALQEAVTERVRELLRQGELLKIKEILKNCEYMGKELCILSVLLQVFRFEAEKDVYPAVFDYSLDLDELVTHYIRLKLYLRRLEFGLPEEDQAELYAYCQETGVSDYFLLYLIKRNIYFRRRVCERISHIFSCEEGEDSRRAKLYRELAQETRDEWEKEKEGTGDGRS